jgi:hypothetical protein
MPDTQLDLFAGAQASPALPSRSWQWDLMLARLPESARLVIHVSLLWTQVVIEQLVCPVMGRRMLWHTGNITRYPAAPGTAPYRVVYLTADAAQGLHRQMPLIEIERDETYVRFRPAGPGEVGPGLLVMPTDTSKG